MCRFRPFPFSRGGLLRGVSLALTLGINISMSSVYTTLAVQTVLFMQWSPRLRSSWLKDLRVYSALLLFGLLLAAFYSSLARICGRLLLVTHIAAVINIGSRRKARGWMRRTFNLEKQ